MATNSAQQTTDSIKPNQHISAGWTSLFCLLAGTICILIWLRHTACLKPAVSTANDDPDSSLPTRKVVHLEVTLDRNEADTDIDIIAVHGLDTTSRDTWTWKDPQDLKNKRKWVNWLRPGMLPASVDRVRILTCDWPADLLVPSDLVQKTIEEYSLLLLDGIENALFVGSARQQDRPIVFIASCLGGLILIRALVHADDKRSSYYRLRRATRGIVFLATPFRGTSFQDVAAWAETGLKAKASIQGREVSRLLDSVKGSTFQLEESDRDSPCEVFSFYELGRTSLPHKAFPWLPSWFFQKKQLVDRSSATLDIISDPLALHRPHSLMNKFQDSGCPDYMKVAGKIEGMVGKIRAGTPLKQADKLIRDKHYTADRLKIQRLSGEELDMDQCYINLAIVEQSGQHSSRSRKEGGTAPSPFSILARQKVEAPDNTMQVELAALFNERDGCDGRPILPRRILIRGRAGVGKTTLCKKIVHEFYKGTWENWTELFDRVLWVPLRNLKLAERRNTPTYTFEDLFCHEFLLPAALSRALATKSSKTLFLLDGLDEVSQDRAGSGSMPRFLDELLSQPNVIITSRPSAKPVRQNLHLELETIGFGPDQVDEYIEKSFINPKTAKTDQAKVDKVQSFLQKHWLVQGLVRIPIQLDALCYTWEEFDPKAVPSTMTGMYNTIVQKLWKKDVVRLEKFKEGYAEVAHTAEIENKITAEMALVECLAFNGLHHDIIDFTPERRDSVVKLCPLQDLPLDETLSRLSFLRTSDTDSNIKDRNYHFIHLTFQEYFAARYFVRQWKNQEGQLHSLTFGNKDTNTETSQPAEFLRKHKYTARYDIFWRFVAGLLDRNGQATDLVDAIEQEPLDLLGPIHQRLVMHCLSEILSKLPTRGALEQRLAQWLLFECQLNNSAKLASEIEFPNLALKTVLLHESTDFRKTILQSLASRASIPQDVAEMVAGRLDDKDWGVRRAAVEVLGARSALPDGVLMALAARLEDEEWRVRTATIRALGARAALPNIVLIAIAARLDDPDGDVRMAAVQAIGRRSVLPDGMLIAVIARLDDKDRQVRWATGQVLGTRAALPDGVLTTVAAKLDNKDRDIRQAAIDALGGWAALPDEVIKAVAARLDDEDRDIQWAAVEALGRCMALPDEVLAVLAARLNNKDKDVRRATIEALNGHRTPPDGIEVVDSDDKDIKRIAMKALLTAVAARLDDQDKDVRRAAVEALGARAALPDEVFMALATRLDDEDWRVRKTAVKALSERTALPNEVLIALAVRLNDKDKEVRKAAVEALGARAALPDDILMALAMRLDDEKWRVRRAAVEALGTYAVLPDGVLTALAALLDDEDENVRAAAVEVLGARTILPSGVLITVTARLNDEDKYVRTAAVEALGTRAALPDGVIIALAARLDDEEWCVRRTAVGALMRRHEKLCRTILDGSLIAPVYKTLIKRSFEEHLSWYIDNGKSCINMSDRISELSIDAAENDVREWIHGARRADCPSTSGLETCLTSSPANG
ncbi:NACHT, LRR and PYD domains-containing protein 3 [Beauveria bassiana]|uniref:NACHT, LRR and PYD domains-containing protein 3 n=1 Tax=Beauveria bassiana TaxID=176275 RepID=A0A2N6NE71_BEABA|nr:NACHT, LRR and PYD domains-containing protein 3 [Beauveria bassiana]